MKTTVQRTVTASSPEEAFAELTAVLLGHGVTPGKIVAALGSVLVVTLTAATRPDTWDESADELAKCIRAHIGRRRADFRKEAH